MRSAALTLFTLACMTHLARSEPTVTICATGDVTFGGWFEPWLDAQVARRRLDAASVISYGFDRVRTILTKADVTLANFEGTFAQKGRRGSGTFAFKARPELADILVDGGIDVVALGNNHTMDFGAAGLVETLDALDAAHIGRSGAGHDVAEARAPWRVTKNGLTLGFLSYKVTGLHSVAQKPSGVVFHATGPTVAWCHFDWPCIRDLVQADVAALAQQVDVVVVSFHWGQERHYDPDAYQVALGHLAVDAGAKVVIGTHPHVLQGVELYNNAVIYYSLGNFLFGGNTDPFDPVGGIAQVTVDRNGVVDAALVPVLTTSLEAPFQPRVLTGYDAELVLLDVAARSRTFARTLPSLTTHTSAP